MSVILPSKDQWTTYNYEVGAKRMSDARKGEFHFLEMLDVRCSGMPLDIISFGEQFDYMKNHRTTASWKLWVTGTEDISRELKLIPKEKTLEFATKSIKKWGREYVERVLSATVTGSLYLHIIHYYGTYDKLLEELDNRGGKCRKAGVKVDDREKKRRRVADESE